MNLRSVDLNLLTVFDAIMLEQNLTRAADRIGMSQPAISSALGRLRLVFKDELFIRTGHGVKPTPQALALADPVRRILDMVVATLSQTRDFDYAASRRVFNLVLSDYGEAVLLPPLMRWLDSLGASVRINVDAHVQKEVKERMRFGSLDLYLWTTPIHDDAFHSQLLLKEELFSLVRRDHPVVGSKLTLEQYLQLRHLTLEWPHADNLRPVEQYLEARGLVREQYLRVHSFLSMPSVVASSDVVCTMPSRMARLFAELYPLKLFPTPLPGLEIPLYLCWHKSFDADPGHQWLRNGLIELCSRL